MAKIREENEKKIIREQERQEQRKREILKHKKQIAEAKRLREQQRRLEEEMEEQARRALAQKQFEKVPQKTCLLCSHVKDDSTQRF